MSKSFFNIDDLRVDIDGNEIIKGLDLEVSKGETHVIMGPNGSGKSTLAYALMGHPLYKITNGSIFLEDEKINDLSADKRAVKGMFLSFQYPEEVDGVTVEEFLRTAKAKVTGQRQGVMKFKKELKKKMDSLDIDPSYSSRYLNLGFSGGEKKKNEILQMSMLEPKISILDETDSGLDVDAIKTVAEGVKNFMNDERSVIVITHYNKVLEYLNPDYIHILMDGQIIKTGSMELAEEIDKNGYEEIKRKYLK